MNEEELTQLRTLLFSEAEQYRKNMEELARNLTAVVQRAQAQIGPVSEGISSAVHLLAEKLAEIDWPGFHAKMQESCERLANLGWTLPMSFTPRELIELAEHGNTDEQVEQFRPEIRVRLA